MSVSDELVALYQQLRVADVCDGMDAANLRDVGLVSRAIRPIWPGARAAGRAVTARYVPSGETVPHMTPEEYAEYEGRWYREKCTYPYIKEAKPGDFLVIDMSGLEVGLWGSSVALSAVAKGVTGVVIDGGCRDTHEVALQRCPVWARTVARTTVIGRLEFESMGGTVEIGAVRVRPGDLVVADDDGVIVVPQESTQLVARVAAEVLEGDKRARRRRYEELGLPVDDTVE
ncbi:MAG: RraA family protein [Planctomycetes bacterium]|nr:RraA family protein [Planctomycetota bacterium]